MVRLSFLRFTELTTKEVLSTSATIDPITRLPPLPSPKELLKLYKIKAQRKLSQNFLLDHKLTNKIVTKTGDINNCFVCEVGPGPGNITRSILQNGAKQVVVIEKDRRFMPSLELLSEASNRRLKIILGDIMNLNLENIFPREYAQAWTVNPPPIYIIGNLPFNISTPLIIKWLRHCSMQTGPFIYGRTQLTLTFQKEVGNRMIAPVDSDCRCRLSVMSQYLCHVNYLFTIPGRAFFPKPEVDVSVVKFTPRIKPLINQPFNLVEKVVSTIFRHRQKHCSFGFKRLFPDRLDLAEKLQKLSGINPTKTSFQLEIQEYSTLCDVYYELCKDNNLLDTIKFPTEYEEVQ